MAEYKKCYCCGKSKETNQFSKRSASKDGLQDKCKACNKIDNLKFRTEINPSHHADWQRNNPERLCEIVKNYRKADKNSIIYSIRNPKGETYIGMTQMYFSVRKLEHISKYNKILKGKEVATLPLLHKSFDKWGIDNHSFEVIADFGKIDRKQLRFIESTFIKSFQLEGKSLNIR